MKCTHCYFSGTPIFTLYHSRGRAGQLYAFCKAKIFKINFVKASSQATLKKKTKHHITFWTRYPLASQGCAPWLCIITTHASEQSFRAEIHQIACISANLGRGAHTPHRHPHPQQTPPEAAEGHVEGKSCPGGRRSGTTAEPGARRLPACRGCTCLQVEVSPPPRRRRHLLRPQPPPQPDPAP